jgi:L-alanine-DL-glutamate epimerase-like enolase superfamily enzyme
VDHVSRIERVSTTRVSTRLHTPFVTALRRTTTTDTVVVRITDSDGVVGWGEAPQVWQVTGESLAGAEACIDGPLTATLVGRHPDDVTETCRAVAAAVAANAGAKAAVDVALHDLAARRRGVSMPVYLGATTLRVPTDVTLAAAPPTWSTSSSPSAAGSAPHVRCSSSPGRTVSEPWWGR